MQFKGQVSHPQETFYFLLSQAETLDPEELELKQKLKKLTENISDKEKCSEENCTSDEDEANQLRDDIKPPGTKEPYFASALRSKTMTSDDFFGSFFRNELSSLQRVRPHDSIQLKLLLCF